MGQKCTMRRAGVLLGLAALLPFSALAADEAAIVFFETRVRPVLAEHCVSCHGPEKQKGGLRLDHGAYLLQGGDNGPAVAPGDPAGSRLLRAVGFGDVELQMPPTGKLPDAVIKDIEAWIAGGAVWPDEPVPGAALSTAKKFDVAALRAAHWAWQPLASPVPPAVQDATWPRGPVDLFVLARLEAAGLAPAPEADRQSLLRRVTFDLTGLPPTAAEARAFAEDTRPDAYEHAVERLLASPRFGEHWARKWLDLVRFAETYGFEGDFAIPEAWRYRDYVVRAINADVPYDQFVREHLAGDLLPAPRINPADGTNESALATGALLLHQSQHAPVDVRMDYADRIDNQIDVFSKTMLGMTVSCARCHDHKFDAISTADYYALAGVFRSARQTTRELDPGGKAAATAARLAAIHARGTALLDAALPKGDTDAAPAPAAQTLGLFEDFGDGYAGWYPEGTAFGKAPTGAKAWMPVNETVHLLPAGVAHSGALGPAPRGTLRSPTFHLPDSRVQVRAAGRGAKIRLVIEGYQLREITPLLFESTLLEVNHGEEFRWLEIGALEKYQGCQAYLEFIDPGDGYLAVDAVAFGGAPMPIDSAPGGEWAAWRAGEANAEQAARLNLALPADLGQMLMEPLREMQAVAQEMPAPMRALGFAEGNGVDEPVFVRGNPKNHGPVVPRGLLEAIAGPEQAALGPGSGRLALADRVLAPSNPLPARVMVNRVWHHLFGRGIVPTVDNFGVMGQAPSHPELLDWLATRYRADGWSLKRLVRTLVTSSTYRMGSSGHDPRAQQLDPTNALLHRMPLRRLPAEPVRDAVLAVAGALDDTAGGPSVPAFISPFMGGHRRPETSGPMDGARRRSIYLEVRRNFLPAFLQAFDFPSPDTTHGARNVSNVPAQSLVLLNDPFVAEQAKAWAARVCADYTETPEQRVERIYWDAFARAPRDGERETALAFIRGQAAAYGITEAAALNDPRAWTDLCHAMYTLKEFVFIG